MVRLKLFAPVFFAMLVACGIDENAIKSAEKTDQYVTVKKFGETLFYDPFVDEWRDNRGTCYTCTPENGFSSAGAVLLEKGELSADQASAAEALGAPSLVWVGYRAKLLDEAGVSPPPSLEVANVLQNHVADAPKHYSVRVRQEAGVFYIIMPEVYFDFDGTIRKRDIFGRGSYLGARYEIEALQ